MNYVFLAGVGFGVILATLCAVIGFLWRIFLEIFE